MNTCDLGTFGYEPYSWILLSSELVPVESVEVVGKYEFLRQEILVFVAVEESLAGYDKEAGLYGLEENNFVSDVVKPPLLRNLVQPNLGKKDFR